MADKLLAKTDLKPLLDALSSDADVFVPAEDDDRFVWTRYAEGVEPRLDYTNTQRSGKEFFFPQCEVLVEYENNDAHAPAEPGRPRIVMGMHPCDARAVSLLSEVFEKQDPPDPYFVAKRNRTTIVSLACNEPRGTCFCSAIEDGSPAGTEGADVLLTDLGDRYLVQPVTDKGTALVEAAGDRLTDATDADATAASEAHEQALAAMTTELDLEKLAEALPESFDDPFWQELQEKCLGCGACAYLCPTCHCFDITDESAGAKGRRVRSWDCCMFPLFTLHGSGHNPRTQNVQRMRQRLMHKFSYFVKNFGRIACVGCGRCILNCPVNMDIREVIGTLSAAVKGAAK